MKHFLLGMAVLSTLSLSALEPLVLDKGVTTLASVSGKAVTIKGNAELHLTSANPVDNSTITLEGDNSMLVFNSLRPSEAKEALKSVNVGAESFDAAKHRLSIYGSGSCVPGGSWGTPLTIYYEENFGGASKDCAQDTYYRDPTFLGQVKYTCKEESLEEFDNHIRSFKLRRGYSAVFANNGNGQGFSRCFVAMDSDIVVPVMPAGLEYASYIRVSRYDWVSKKGICNGGLAELTKASWYYSWGGGGTGTENSEFVPQRHKLNTGITAQTNISCLLGFNEPDHTDQANMTYGDAIDAWPKMMEFGYRIGSPAPDAVNDDWLRMFMRYADSLNYRVDFVATHMYWNGQSAAGLNDNIARECKNYFKGRPMWITEWNNGANWTNEAWPDASGNQLDAEFNPVLDENGNPKTTNRPHTQANSEKQCEWLASMLKGFEDNPYMERHAFYNWVQDARAIELGGKLTPAGKIFADFQSKPALTRENEYVHEWRLAPPAFEISKHGSKLYLKFYDHNGETGDYYIIKHRLDKGEWEDLYVLKPGEDFNMYKSNIIYYTPDINGKHAFRMQAYKNDGTKSLYSRAYSYTWTTAGIDEVSAAAENMDITVANGCIKADGLPAGSWPVYTLEGRLADTMTADSEGIAESRTLAPGVYFLLNKKVLVR